MKKIIRIGLYIVGGYVFVAAIIGLFFQTVFFILVPPAYVIVSAVAKQTGYDFICYDLHNDWQCKFRKTQSTDAEIKQKQNSIFSQSQCHADSDCIVTEEGNCAVKGLFPAKPPGEKKCVCAMGPTVYGCFPVAAFKPQLK